MPPPSFLRFLKLLMVIFWWSHYCGLTSATSSSQTGFTIPGGVHYHWHWDEQDQKIIKRVYESHENYTFTALQLPAPRPHPATKAVHLALLTFVLLTALLGGAALLYEVLIVRRSHLLLMAKILKKKSSKEVDLEAGQKQPEKEEEEKQQLSKPSANKYAFFENRDITLVERLGRGKFGTVWRASVEPRSVGGSFSTSSSSSSSSSSEHQQQEGQSSSPSTSAASNTSTTTTSNVAVKIFAGEHERSLAMERFVYELPGVAAGHPNLLRYLGAFEVGAAVIQPDEGGGGGLSSAKKLKKEKKKKKENPPPPPQAQRVFWLVTEYHQTGSLYDYLSRPPQEGDAQWSPLFTVDQLLSLAHGLASGLSFLHNFDQQARGIMSSSSSSSSIALRDLKSANVILKVVEEEGTLKFCPLIADFGLAVVFTGGPDDASFTAGGAASSTLLDQVGTPRYMAPELLAGHLDLGSIRAAYLAVDMYALGLVLWELLSRTKVEESSEDLGSKYQPPYQEYLGERRGEEEGSPGGPSVAEMHSLVVGRRLRPSLRPVWFTSSGEVKVLAEAMVDCWDVDGEARLPAATLLLRLEALLLLASKKVGV